MPDPSENSFTAAIKALNEVVTPAVDRTNSLAVEQLRLVSMFLEFYWSTRDLSRKLDWTELNLNIELGQTVCACFQSTDPMIKNLNAILLLASSDLKMIGLPALKWRDHTQNIQDAVSRLLRSSADQNIEIIEILSPKVLEKSGEILALKRSWFLSFGFEAKPDELPSLNQLFERCPDI